jgi:hypothetical protein
MSAHKQAAANYKADAAKRAEEYALGIDRGTGSHRWLPVSLEIVDGLEQVGRKMPSSQAMPSDARSLATGTAVKASERDVTHADKVLEPVGPFDWIPSERNHLLKLAADKIKGDDLLQFEQNTKDFEKRAKEQGLSQWEVAQTYKQIAKIFESDSEQPIPIKERVKIAQQVMSQAAHPTTVTQGGHNTCGVTVVETRLYAKNPSAVAKLVADISTKGEYSAPDGTHVKLPPECLKPDPEARNENPESDDRSYASQLFQVTAANVWYAKENATTTPPGKKVYLQVEPLEGSKPPDTGERLIDPSQDLSIISGKTGLKDDHIVAISNIISGQQEKDIFIEHKDLISGQGKDVTLVSSEHELNEKLAHLKEQGKLPLIVAVHTDNQPFFTDSGGYSAGGSGGAHVVTITDYHPGPPATVEIDNQWAASKDHLGESDAIKVHDLYLAMRFPTDEATIAALEKDVIDNRKHNQIDASQELQLLRLKHKASEEENEDSGILGLVKALNSRMLYDQQIVSNVLESEKRWAIEQANGTFDHEEHSRAIRLLNNMLKEMVPIDRQKAIIDALKENLPGNKDIEKLEGKVLSRLIQ